MIRAVFFDLDGTLADTERQNAEAVARALAARGRTVSDEERNFVIGHGWREIYDQLVAAGGVDLGFDELMAAASHEREQLVAKDGLDVLPGAVAAVRRVAARYQQVGIVSGSSRQEVEACVRALGVAECLRLIVAAEDAPRGKPAPDGYLLAAWRLGVEPGRCLVIEDSAAGIAAARAAGMTCVAVRAGNFAGQPQDRAHLVLDSLLELDDARLAALEAGTYTDRVRA